MAKRFFYTAMGILALAAAYHLGAARTEAQGTAQFVGLAGVGGGVDQFYAVTADGDVWGFIGANFNPLYTGNLSGGPVPVESESFGSIKSQFK